MKILHKIAPASYTVPMLSKHGKLHNIPALQAVQAMVERGYCLINKRLERNLFMDIVS